MYEILPLSIGLTVVAIANILLASVMFVVKPHRVFHMWAGILAMSCALWTFGIALFLSFTEANTSTELVIRGYYFSAATIAYALVMLALSFPTTLRHIRRLRVLTTILYLMSAWLTFGSNLVRGVHIGSGEGHVAMLGGVEYAAYITYFVCFALLAIGVFLHRYHIAVRTRDKTIGAQLRTMMIGISVALTFGMIFNLLLPAIGNYALIWVGPPFTLVFVGSIIYGILRHGLFDIKHAITRSIAYVLALSTLACIYIACASLFFREQLINQPISFFSTAVLSTFAVLLFGPVKRYFDKLTDKIFFQNRYNSGEFYGLLSQVLANSTDLRSLLQRAATVLSLTLKADYANFIIRLDDGKKIIVGDSSRRSVPNDDVVDLDKYVHQHGDDIIVTELLPPSGRLRRNLTSHDIALCVPLVKTGEATEYLLLGHHKGAGFTNRDVTVLQTVTDELIIAIQNAKSIQQVKDINAHLQQRIDAATNELRMSNARLKRLDAAKDEFISMASHQLRTPLTSVKGYLSMVLEGDVGKVTKMQRQVLEEAYSSSERMVHLIHDFLNVSRLQTGKFALETQQSDVSKLVAEEVKSLERVATSHGLILELKDTVGPLTMTLDDTKIRQVVMNYIDNAIFYSHPDTTIAIKFEKVANEVIFSVKDTGIGVPKKEQAQLFGKFFRASNARKERPDGTGVGLFLAKKIIDAHHGEVIFSSAERKGSTFGFRLPIGALDK